MKELHVVYGTSPVGTARIELLMAQGKPVRVVTRSGARKHLPPQVEMIRGDATDPVNARQICEGASHVYNRASGSMWLTDFHQPPPCLTRCWSTGMLSTSQDPPNCISTTTCPRVASGRWRAVRCPRLHGECGAVC